MEGYLCSKWRKGDFSGDPSSPGDTGIPSRQRPLPTPTPTITDPPPGSPVTEPPPPPSWSRGAIAGLIAGIISLGLLALCLGAPRLRNRRRRRRGAHRGIELDDDPGEGIGFRVLHGGDGSSTEIADIILVHGLNGHRTRTWTKDGRCWPRDFLPHTLPGARIMAFGYDSTVMRWRGASHNSIGRHASMLLSDLQNMRGDNPDRPIIFVGHSLGGIVIKDALCKANAAGASLRDTKIFNSTYGIIFLGTPHRGSGYARLGWAGAAITHFWRGMNIKLVQTLRHDSDILDRVNTDFLRRSHHFKICSFAEELPVMAFFPPIVSVGSAFIGLPFEIQETIWASHRDICRFADEEDVGYRRLVRWITEFVAEATSSRVPEEGSTSTTQPPLIDTTEPESVDIAG
ncbi:Alpha/Beta hydrolase protein [Lasiosphaeria ovina]|uniref:Alpha/Beta hydrolase protein n=1 Tax=Lasiosphaeria ovina TaxID=92902 RepID=A0AAE0K6L9_9PEZI|nr:Alpha/Beta hydrolase protein [Lasiosphaeria ovina]